MSKKLVILKFGTNTLRVPESIPTIVEHVMTLRRTGFHPLIVSSGARDRAVQWVHTHKDESQDWSVADQAALGSSLLFREWVNAFEQEGVVAVQLLPTHTNFMHDGEAASVGERTARFTFSPQTIVVANWNDYISDEAMDEVRRGRGENDLHTVLLTELMRKYANVSHVLFVTEAGGFNMGDVRVPELRLDDHPSVKLQVYEAMDRTRGGKTSQNGILPKLCAADKCAAHVDNVALGSISDIVPFVVGTDTFTGTRIVR